jgi:hypothetical protein
LARGCAFDHDSDGNVDLFFLNAPRLTHHTDRKSFNRLYWNPGNGRFGRDRGIRAERRNLKVSPGIATGDMT